MTSLIDDFFWHDGNILSLAYSIRKTGVLLEIEGEFYSNPESNKRDVHIIECNGVSRFNSIIDFEELLDNLSAGSISNGYIKGDTLWLYLSDGVIEIHAKQINVSKQ